MDEEIIDEEVTDDEIIEEIEDESFDTYVQEARDNEPVLVDWQMREIDQPANLGTIGVTSDERVHPIIFRLPRFYKGIDLADFKFRINYQNPEGESDIHAAIDLEVLEEELRFTWLLSRFATQTAGLINFIVCGIKYADDGVTIEREINSVVSQFEVLVGLEIEDSAEFAERLDWLAEWLKPVEDAEKARRAAEAAREEAEKLRVTAENARKDAEDMRNTWLQEAFEKFKEEMSVRSQCIEATPWEPPDRFHGKIWYETDEETGTILHVWRWDEYKLGSGLYPAPDLYPSDELYPIDVESYGLFPSDEIYPADDLYPDNGKWTELFFPFTGGGTSDYNLLSNKPQINSVELKGNKSLPDIGIETASSDEITSIF